MGPRSSRAKRAEQHLQAEERAADGHVVGGGDPRRRPARDEDAGLPLLDPEPGSEPGAGGGARLHESPLAAEGGAHRHRADGDRAAREGPAEGELAPAVPDRLDDPRGAVAGEGEAREEREHRDGDPREDGDRDAVEWARRLDRPDEGLRARPREPLDDPQDGEERPRARSRRARPSR